MLSLARATPLAREISSLQEQNFPVVPNIARLPQSPTNVLPTASQYRLTFTSPHSGILYTNCAPCIGCPLFFGAWLSDNLPPMSLFSLGIEDVVLL